MTTMTMRAVPDGNGGFRHVPTPFVPIIVGKGRGKAKKATPPDPIVTNGESGAEQLRLGIERLERLHEERMGISEDIRDVESELKSTGFDIKGRFLMSINDTPGVRATFAAFAMREFETTYTVGAGKSTKAAELLISNYIL